MKETCEWWDRAWDDTVPVGEEGIGPLLEKAVEGSKVMWCLRSEVELPLTCTYRGSSWNIFEEGPL
jgi:hypothetical protein